MTKEELQKQCGSVGYFSMEIGLDSCMKTYAGGLGILAGDTLKSAADLGLDIAGVSILYKQGYFKQVLSETGEQMEHSDLWNFESYLTDTGKKVSCQLKEGIVTAEIWKYEITGIHGSIVPVYFLNTDIEENSSEYKYVSYNLYTPFKETQIRQELVLGVLGVKALDEMGHGLMDTYHLNESHAAFGVIAVHNLLPDDRDVRKHIVFTTHTPAKHGHKMYDRDYLENYLTDEYISYLDDFFEDGKLHLTKFSLSHAKYSNAVSKRHGEVSKELFPDKQIDSITNGIHLGTWAGEATKRMFNIHLGPNWQAEVEILSRAVHIPDEDILFAHRENKFQLSDYVLRQTGEGLDPNVFTIGFGRRVDGYKRWDFILKHLSVLRAIADTTKGIQVIFGGKAYFDYKPSEDVIASVAKLSKQDLGNLNIVFLENYSMEAAKMMIMGSDLWLNNPIKPLEASGTSGMKAALNGVPSLSTIDGWWYEGHEEGITGWAIGDDETYSNDDEVAVYHLYSKLEHVILPMYYENVLEWANVMKNSIARNASYFNTDRMLREYVNKGYAL